MIAEAFAYSIAVTLLIGLAALSVERFLAEIGRPRRTAWLVAYAAALTFPPAALLLATGTPAVETVIATSAAAVTAAPSPLDWDTLLLRLWAAATTVLLLAYVASSFRLATLAKGWPRVGDDEPLVVLSDDVGPAVLGILRPRIVLPRWLMDSPASVRSTIMAHELEHIAARDQASIVAAQLVTVLLPWNLPLWWFARRLRLGIEVDCDARVLRRGVDAEHYADVLLQVGQRRSAVPFAAATLIEPVTQLERRIRIMLTRRRPMSLRHAAAATALAVAITACASRIEPPVIVTSEPTEPFAERAVTTPEQTQPAGKRPTFLVTDHMEVFEGANGELTIHAGNVIVSNSDDAHTQITAENITQTPDSLVFEGNVRLVFGEASLTATRAVAKQGADGGMTFAAENVVVKTRRAQ